MTHERDTGLDRELLASVEEGLAIARSEMETARLHPAPEVIETEEHYQHALAEAAILYDHEPAVGSPQAKRLDQLSAAIEAYEGADRDG
ncbi:MAG: hypothetical protein JWR10_2415 [Rubritepida sp.]|nr:hypothetical protein [Rubritepida sp.]